MTAFERQWGGGWSDRKLVALSQYLTQYTKALKNQPFELNYIDAFAGAGSLALATEAGDEPGEEVNYRHGSPLVALGTEPVFDRFIFIEASKKNLSALRSQIEEKFPNHQPTYLEQDANDALLDICNQNWIESNRRGVVFLDPFAVHLKWETIRRIGQTKALDMWLLFPAMAINRMLPRYGQVPEAWKEKLTETFGTEQWESAFYKDEGPDLFFDKNIAKTNQIFGQLCAFVVQRLKSEFVGVVEEPLVLKTDSGSPLFLLCFASGNPKGAPIATRIAGAIIKKA